jgi:hypothetical protein
VSGLFLGRAEARPLLVKKSHKIRIGFGSNQFHIEGWRRQQKHWANLNAGAGETIPEWPTPSYPELIKALFA